MELAQSYTRRALNKENEAENYAKKYNFAESISASQECIELSIKAMFLMLSVQRPRTHEFKEEEFETLLQKIPEKLKFLNVPKLYLYSKFWSSFYTVAKYGLERMGVGSEGIFQREEAELALKHAKDCRSAAMQLDGYLKHPW